VVGSGAIELPVAVFDRRLRSSGKNSEISRQYRTCCGQVLRDSWANGRCWRAVPSATVPYGTAVFRTRGTYGSASFRMPPACCRYPSGACALRRPPNRALITSWRTARHRRDTLVPIADSRNVTNWNLRPVWVAVTGRLKKGKERKGRVFI